MEYGNQDLYEVFKKINNRLDGLEAQAKYPTENREKFMAACLKDKSMSECSELWKQVKEKGEQAGAYGKPTKLYGKTFIDAILETLEKAGIELTSQEEMRLRALARKTGEVFGDLSFGEVSLQDKSSGITRTYSVLPQEHTSGEALEKEIEEEAKAFMNAGKEHQKRKSLLDEE